MFKKSVMALLAASLLSVSAMADTNQLQDGDLDLSPTYNGWYIGGSYSWQPLTDGSADSYVTLEGKSGKDAYMTQTFNVLAGTTYTVSFDYIASKGTQWGIQNGDSSSSSWVNYDNLAKVADWTKVTYTFTALASGVDTIGFTAPNAKAKLSLNNISVTAAAVPEPASMALFLAGLGGLGLVSRRRRVK